MTAATLTATHEGQAFTLDLGKVTGWDAIAYRSVTGEHLDARLGAMMLAAPESAEDWPLADRALLAWLWLRQSTDPNASLAEVAGEVTLLPGGTDD